MSEQTNTAGSGNGSSGTNGNSASHMTSNQNKSQSSSSSGRNRFRRPNNKRPPVAKPKPKNQNTRQVEIDLLKKGYPGSLESDDGVAYSLELPPTDPDFPFDISALRFTMFVPQDYPKSAPYIVVANQDIPRGYAANVEAGFRELAVQNLGRLTLMNLTVQLDRNLEQFLSRDKQDTVKLVRPRKDANSRGENSSAADQKSNGSTSGARGGSSTVKGESSNGSNQMQAHRFNPRKHHSFVPQEVKEERLRQIDQLKHRVDATLFNETAGSGTTYAVYITPPHSEILPEELIHFRAQLFIPEDYNMSACSITIPSVADIAARNIERNFNNHALVSKRRWSLVALINYLTTQLEQLMLPEETLVRNERPSNEEKNEADSQAAAEFKFKRLEDTASGDEDDGDDSIDEDEPKTDNEPVEDSTEEANSKGIDMPPLSLRGTALVFPGLRLSHIGFLECQTLNLVVKCTRCKTTNDLLNLLSAPYGRESKAVGTACSKCNATLAASFRKDLIHAHNNRAGLLDFSGCTPFDMLPSSFVPTCENCSTTLSQPFRKMELGKTSNAPCRECHCKMTMFIPEFRFDLISEDGSELKLKVKKNKAKENLGITGGTALPNDGSCSHYKKSHRWFRFSCCGKVYPCDKCHDDKADHPNERAHRMICGKCSREQNFSATCIYCKNTFETRHSGFWEGGTGERDKARLSRKDPRKHSRKGVSQSAIAANNKSKNGKNKKGKEKEKDRGKEKGEGKK